MVCTCRKCLRVAWGCVWPADIFCLDCGTVFLKCFFFLFDPTFKNKKTLCKITISNFSGKIQKSGNSGLKQQALVYGLPPSFVTLEFTDWCSLICDHLSLSPRGQGSSEQSHFANKRVRIARINMFHYQPKPLELCFLTSNQNFLTTTSIQGLGEF